MEKNKKENTNNYYFRSIRMCILFLSFFIIFSIILSFKSGFTEKNSIVEDAIQKLKSSEISTSIEGIRTLRELSDSKAIPALIEALNSKSWRVRCMAAETLSKFKDPQVINALQKRFEYECSKKKEQEQEYIIGYMSLNLYIQRQFALALKNIGTLQSYSALEEFLTHDNIYCRYQAALALGNTTLKERKENPILEKVVQATIPILIEILEDEKEGSLRALAAKSLGILRANEAIPNLIKALKDNYQTPYKRIYIVRVNAAESLKLLGVRLQRESNTYKIIESKEVP